MAEVYGPRFPDVDDVAAAYRAETTATAAEFDRRAVESEQTVAAYSAGVEHRAGGLGGTGGRRMSGQPEWDSQDSGAHQARVEAGEIDQCGEPRQAGRDEWGELARPSIGDMVAAVTAELTNPTEQNVAATDRVFAAYYAGRQAEAGG